jgi:hypothetical protein
MPAPTLTIGEATTGPRRQVKNIRRTLPEGACAAVSHEQGLIDPAAFEQKNISPQPGMPSFLLLSYLSLGTGPNHSKRATPHPLPRPT